MDLGPETARALVVDIVDKFVTEHAPADLDGQIRRAAARLTEPVRHTPSHLAVTPRHTSPSHLQAPKYINVFNASHLSHRKKQR